MSHRAYPVNSGYGWRTLSTGERQYHPAEDENTPQGLLLGAPRDCTVRVYPNWSAQTSYGTWVACLASRFEMRLAHLSRVLVPDGARVRANQPIVHTGGTPGTLGAGGSSGDHCHIEVLIDGEHVPPGPYYGGLHHPTQPAPTPSPGEVSEMVLFRRGSEPQVYIWWGTWRQPIARDTFNRIAAGMGLSQGALFARVLSLSPPDGWHLYPLAPPRQLRRLRRAAETVTTASDWADLVEGAPLEILSPLEDYGQIDAKAAVDDHGREDT